MQPWELLVQQICVCDALHCIALQPSKNLLGIEGNRAPQRQQQCLQEKLENLQKGFFASGRCVIPEDLRSGWKTKLFSSTDLYGPFSRDGFINPSNQWVAGIAGTLRL